MNKKIYVFIAVFIFVFLGGAGIFYYFDPGMINGAFGVDSMTMNATSDVDLSLTEGSSSSLPAVDLENNDDDASVAPAPAKKSLKKAKTVNISEDETAISPSKQADVAITDVSSGTSGSAPTFAATCSFPESIGAVSGKIILNEIAWMGSASSSNAEWMEIKNNSSDKVGLSGWELLSASGKIKISFDADDAIAPGGFLLLARAGAIAGVAGGAGTKTYSGDLSNAGDILALTDPGCALSAYLDASHGWPAGNNVTKQTMERDADGIGWHTSASPGGTPGKENSAGIPLVPTASSSPAQDIAPTATSTPASLDPATSTELSESTTTITAGASSTPADDSSSSTAATVGHLLIAAVQIGGASSSNDFVKLYNPTAGAIDISGWKLHKKSQTGTDYSIKTVPAGSTIAAGQSFIWANSVGGFSESMGADISSTETLSADNSVALMDPTGAVVDAVAWGTGTDQYEEGSPYPTDPGAGQVLLRSIMNGVMADTGNNAADFSIQ
jgi:hypothetical protein